MSYKVDPRETSFFQPAVEDKDLTVPPAYSKGKRYIVGAGATGAWNLKGNYIVDDNGAGWDFITPKEGMVVYIKDEDKFYKYISSWTELSPVETATTIATLLHAATDKTSFADNDEIPIIDSAASNVLKKNLWSVVKSTLKTYSDTLYQGLINILVNGGTVGTNGVGVIAIKKGTPPSTSPSDTVQLYSDVNNTQIDYMEYSSDGTAQAAYVTDSAANLQSYSEATIKTQGSYALKAVAAITNSLNKTLTKTFASPIDFSGLKTVNIDMRASRTGANVKLGLRNVGGNGVITQSQVSSDDNLGIGWNAGGLCGFSQGFKVSTTNNIVKLTWRLFKDTAVGTLTGYIYSDNSGVPNSAVATFSSINLTTLDVRPNANNFDFTGTFTPVVGTQYHIVLVWTNGGAGNVIVARFVDVGGYTDGKIGYALGSGWETVGAAWDAYFKIYQAVTTELTPTIATADTYQTVSWDISAVADADKNAIDKFIITPTNAAAANTFYIDNFYSVGLAELKVRDEMGNITTISSHDFKVGSFTRDVTAVSGDVAYTGVGFTPKVIDLFANLTDLSNSFGFDDGTTHNSVGTYGTTGGIQQIADTGKSIVIFNAAGTGGQKAIIKTFDADGFTLTWTKIGTPAAGTVTCMYKAAK